MQAASILFLFFLINKPEIKQKRTNNYLVRLNTDWTPETHDFSTVNGDSDPGSVLAMRQFLLIKSTMSGEKKKKKDSINFEED